MFSLASISSHAFGQYCQFDDLQEHITRHPKREILVDSDVLEKRSPLSTPYQPKAPFPETKTHVRER